MFIGIRKIAAASLLVVAIGASIPTTANADTFCSSFGMYSYCANVPSYQTPAPEPVQPVPKWVCTTVSVTSIILSWLPTVPVVTLVSRVVSVPSTYCTFV